MTPHSFPSSFAPHEYFPGVFSLEGRIKEVVRQELECRGHHLDIYGQYEPMGLPGAGPLCR